MGADQASSITQLLAAVGDGDAAALNDLWALVYSELHQLAQAQLAIDGAGRSLQPTTLIHEAYLRLTGGEDVHWENRRHFFAAAAKAMRRICVDYARKRKCLKRGGGKQPGPLVSEPPVFDKDPAMVLAVDEAVTKLEQIDPRKAEVVVQIYFAGRTVKETAQILGISPKTVDNELRFAKAWLLKEMSKGDTVLRPGGDKV